MMDDPRVLNVSLIAWRQVRGKGTEEDPMHSVYIFGTPDGQRVFEYAPSGDSKVFSLGVDALVSAADKGAES